MAATEWIDLYCATPSASVLTQLANRDDAGVKGVTSTPETKRKLVALILRCSATGYVKLIMEGNCVATADLATLNAQTVPVPIEADVPIGRTLGVYVYQTASAAAAYATALVERK